MSTSNERRQAARKRDEALNREAIEIFNDVCDLCGTYAMDDVAPYELVSAFRKVLAARASQVAAPPALPASQEPDSFAALGALTFNSIATPQRAEQTELSNNQIMALWNQHMSLRETPYQIFTFARAILAAAKLEQQ